MKASAATAALTVLMLAVSVQAATVYSQNFDALTAGTKLSGQGTPPFTITSTVGSANDLAGTVNATAGVGGSKAFAINAEPMLGSTGWYQRINGTTGVSGADQFVTMSFDFNVNPPLTATTTDRSSFSVGLYNAFGFRISYLQISESGQLDYVDAAGANTTYVLPTPINASQGFHNFSVTFDFALSAPTGTVRIDGNVLPITAGTTVSSGKTLGFLGVFGNGGGNDVGVFDNLLLSTSVPEPTSLALLSLGGLAALRRRRA